MKLDIIELLSLFTLIQLLFLTFVILNYKKGKRLSNLLLAGFMASNALLIAHYLLSHFDWISRDKSIAIYCIGSSMYSLLMPFLYLYIRSLCYKDFRLKLLHLLHTTPFVIFVLFSLFVYIINHTSLLTNGSISFKRDFEEIEFWSHRIILHLQIFLYLIASATLLNRYRKRLRDLYSYIEKIDLYWCNILLAGFAAMWFLDLLNWVLLISHSSSNFTSHWIFIFSILINLTFTLVITYKGLAQSVSFSGILTLPKYATSRFKPSDCKNVGKKLTTFIKNEKPYLSPSLSIEDLSKKFNLSVKNISQAIHTCFNQNFYDYINSYRIEEIKERIRDKHYRNLTLLAIAYDAGFNSKSVFNAAFKKHTGVTPKEFKRQYIP